jgi:hypothetical protein
VFLTQTIIGHTNMTGTRQKLKTAIALIAERTTEVRLDRVLDSISESIPDNATYPGNTPGQAAEQFLKRLVKLAPDEKITDSALADRLERINSNTRQLESAIQELLNPGAPVIVGLGNAADHSAMPAGLSAAEPAKFTAPAKTSASPALPPIHVTPIISLAPLLTPSTVPVMATVAAASPAVARPAPLKDIKLDAKLNLKPGTLGHELVSQLTHHAAHETKEYSPYDVLEKIAKSLTLAEQAAFINNAIKTFSLDSKEFEAAGAVLDELQQKLAAYYKDKPVKDVEKAALKDAIKKFYPLLKEKLKTYYDPSHAEHWATLVRQVCDIPADPQLRRETPGAILSGSGMLNTELNSHNDANPKSKVSLLKVLSNNMSDYRYASPKSGGANSPGEFGGNYLGCYCVVKDGIRQIQIQSVFFKQATDDNKPNHRENISEVVAGRIMNKMIGDSSATVFFANPPNHTPGAPKDPYVASVLYDNYESVYDRAYKEHYKKTHPGVLDKDIPAPPARPKGNDPGAEAKEGMEILVLEKKMPHPGRLFTASLMVGNRQFHFENMATATVLKDGSNIETETQFVSIDFGGAFRRQFNYAASLLKKGGEKLAAFIQKKTGVNIPTLVEIDPEVSKPFQKAIHPHQTSGVKYRANYLLGVPLRVRMSKAFIDDIDAETNYSRQSLVNDIKEALDDAKPFNSLEALKTWALGMGIPEDKLNGDKDNVMAAAQVFLNEVVPARQLSLREYGLELKLSNCISKKPNIDATFVTDQGYDIKNLIKNNPFYFIQGNYHFRGPDQKDPDGSLRTPIDTELSNMVYFKAKETLATENLSDIDQILMNDMSPLKNKIPSTNEDIKSAAENLLARLRILDSLTDKYEIKSEKSKRYSFILYLEETLKNIDLSDADEKSIFIQAFDEAYRTCVDTYQLLAKNIPLSVNRVRVLELISVPQSAEPQYQKNYHEILQAMALDTKACILDPLKSNSADPTHLGTILLADINSGDPKKAPDAIDSIFEIVSCLEFPAQYAFIKSLHTTFNLPDDKLWEKLNLETLYKSYLTEKNQATKNMTTDIFRRRLLGIFPPEDKLKDSSEFNQIYDVFKTYFHSKTGDGQTENWKKVINAIPTDPLNHTDIFRRSVNKATIDPVTDDVLRAIFSRDMNNYRYISPKYKSKKSDAGKLEGWYIGCYREQNGKIKTAHLLLKQSKNRARNFVESLAGRLKTLLVGDKHVASTFLVTDPSGLRTADHTYAASIAKPNYKEITSTIGADGSTEPVTGRPHWIGTRDAITGTGVIQNEVQRLVNEGYVGFEECLLGALFVNDHDVTSDNIGTNYTSDEALAEKLFFNIDHETAIWNGLEPTVDNQPGRDSVFGEYITVQGKNLAVWGVGEPTFHELEYRENQRYTKRFADIILERTDAISKEILEKTIDGEISYERAFLEDDLDGFKKYAARLNITLDHKLIADKEKILDPKERLKTQLDYIENTIKISLKNSMYARLIDLRRIAMDVQLSHCFKWSEADKKFTWDNSKYQIEDLIRRHPTYFIEGKFNFLGQDGGHSKSSFQNDLRELVKKKMTYVLDQENLTGIQKILAKDFVSNDKVNFDFDLLLRARRIQKRIDLLKQITRDPIKKNQFDEIILTLGEHITRLSNNDHSRDQHLAQLCDMGYETIIKTVQSKNNAPTLEQIRMVEILAEDDPFDPGILKKTIEVRKSLVAKDLLDSVSRYYEHIEYAPYNANAQKNLTPLHNTVNVLTQRLTQLEHESTPELVDPDDYLSQAKVKLDKIHTALRNHHAAANQPQTKQLYPFFRKNELVAMPIDIKPGETALSSLQTDVRFKRLRGEELEAIELKNVAINVVGDRPPKTDDIVSTNKAIFIPNPVSKENIAHPDRPASGFLMSYNANTLTHHLDEIKEEDRLTVATIIAEQLYDKPWFKLAREAGDERLPVDQKGLDERKADIRKLVQEHYVDYIQIEARRPESVTTANLKQFLEKTQNAGLCQIATISNPFRKKETNWSLETIAEELNKTFIKETTYASAPGLPNADFLAMGHFWFSLIKANPNIKLENLVIKNTQGNPMFFKSLFLNAELFGLDQRRINMTGYETLYATDEEKARYKYEMNNANSPLRREIDKKVLVLEQRSEALLQQHKLPTPTMTGLNF